MASHEEILKSLGIVLDDLTPAQIEGLTKVAERMPDPRQMGLEDAKHIVEDLGLDIEGLRKKYRQRLAENRKPKVGVNEKCPCGSGKKYKKCCLWK
jgi:preprotein translocase subunit SecA